VASGSRSSSFKATWTIDPAYVRQVGHQTKLMQRSLSALYLCTWARSGTLQTAQCGTPSTFVNQSEAAVFFQCHR
jgi:hypothetical protein